MFNVYQNINLEDKIVWWVHLHISFKFRWDPPARSDAVVGERMHLCKHIYFIIVCHIQEATLIKGRWKVWELGAHSMAWTCCMYVHYPWLDLLCRFLWVSDKTQKNIYITAKFSVSFFSYQVTTFPAEEKYHIHWIQSMRIKLIYFTFEILTYTANFIHMFIYFYSYNMISIYNFFSWWLFLLSCSNTTNFLLE